MEARQNKSSILVPVVQEKEIIASLFSWIEQNSHLWDKEIVLIHIAEPLWVKKLPYTALQADVLLQEQDEIEKELQHEFNAIVEQIRRRISRLSIRAIVKTTHTPAESIVEYAREISADYIVMISRERHGFEQLFESQLINRITHIADRDVQVIKKAVKDRRHNPIRPEGSLGQM